MCAGPSGSVGVVAGWNIITDIVMEWFGTLLGPEETPGDRLFFLAAPGLDRLTHPDELFRVGVVVVVSGWGVVVC